jgi:hypothetical protein
VGLKERIALYEKLENKRKRPLIVYVTGSRRNAEAQIASDVIPELVSQLQSLPGKSTELDLLLVSNGGDGTVAWRIVSLIRERVSKLSVLVPQAAFSAATLIAQGADEIVMHPHGNLGPTDPQITNRTKNVQFGSEDLVAFLKFAREEVGLTDQMPLLELFKKFSEEVGFVGIGVAARSAQLTVSMGEKLLKLHMKSESQAQKAKLISEALNTKFFHHGYPVSRTEARDIGLPVAPNNPSVESLMRSIWLDIEDELKLRQPFSPVNVLKSDKECAALFAPVAPPAPGQPPPAMPPIPPANYEIISGIMESCRHATRAVSAGAIFAMRLPDLKLNFSVIPYSEGWVDMDIRPQKNKKTASKAQKSASLDVKEGSVGGNLLKESKKA